MHKCVILKLEYQTLCLNPIKLLSGRAIKRMRLKKETSKDVFKVSYEGLDIKGCHMRSARWH